jgi:hypothetical protein
MAKNHLKDKSFFSSRDTPIFGMTNADEYFPITNIAGNIATIVNTIPGTKFPHTFQQVKPMEDQELYEFHREYFETYNLKKSLPKVLFVGHIPAELRFTLPLILYQEGGKRQIFQPYCINKSISSFKKEFGINYNDFVIAGFCEDNTSAPEILNEAQEEGLTILTIEDYFDYFSHLLQQISEQARNSTLPNQQCTSIDARLQLIEKDVEKQIK